MNRLPTFVLPALLASSLLACGDDAKRPLGATCGASAECESGLCISNECVDPAGDLDGDGLTNGLEASLSSDPASDDTDGDGIEDGVELGPNPSAPLDSDGDGLPDLIESLLADQDNDCENDQVDPTNTTPGSTCPVEAAEYVLLNPYWAVESTGTAAVLIPGYRILEGVALDDAGLSFTDECVSDGLAISSGATTGFARTVSWCLDEDVAIPASYDATGLTIRTERETSLNPQGQEEVIEAQTIVLSATAPDGFVTSPEVLLGQNLREYSLTVDGTSISGKEVNLFAMVKKSNLLPAAVQGTWGLVGLFANVDPAAVEVEYGVGAFFATVVSDAASGGLSLVMNQSVEAIGTQGFAGPADSRLAMGEPDPLDLPPLPMTVTDGLVRIDNEGNALKGAISASGDFLIMASTVPEVGSARGTSEPQVDESPGRFGLELIVGVKQRLMTSSTIGGKVYRIYRVELTPSSRRFGIMSATGSMTIDEAGQRATLTGDLVRWGVDFAGVGQREDLPSQELVMNVGFVEQGAFVLSEPDAPMGDFSAMGFAGEDGRLIVLGDHSDESDESGVRGTFALMLGVCLNCPAP